MCGIGKTRLGKEIFLHLRESFPAKHFFYLYIMNTSPQMRLTRDVLASFLKIQSCKGLCFHRYIVFPSY